jgi:GNAT superfamily N-acetyltransferase
VEGLTLHLSDDPGEEARLLSARLDEHAALRLGGAHRRGLSVLCRNGGALVAGLSGWTHAGCLQISVLFVDEALRGRGLGGRLVSAAEREALSRGCARAFLSTFGFQAPRFYQRLGYEIFGAFEDLPGGARYFLTKRLSPAGEPR